MRLDVHSSLVRYLRLQKRSLHFFFAKNLAHSRGWTDENVPSNLPFRCSDDSVKINGKTGFWLNTKFPKLVVIPFSLKT